MKGETTKTNIATMVKETLTKCCKTNWYEDTYKEIEKNSFKVCQALVEYIKDIEKALDVYKKESDRLQKIVNNIYWKEDHKVYLVTLERNGERELRSIDASMSFAVPNAKALMEYIDSHNNYEGEEVIVGIYEKYENDGISIDMLRGFPLIRFVLTEKGWDITY